MSHAGKGPAISEQVANLELHGVGSIVVLTGAGISAESGIPTFRGPEGYWVKGSRNYRPEELATYAAFEAEPDVIWAWYLHRLNVCRNARPNHGHRALAKLEEGLGERFLLVTQNVDGLHLEAGSSPERCHEIHGNIRRVRCAEGCSPLVYPLPREVSSCAAGEDLRPRDRELLTCPGCGGWLRPHVLWFDEYYNEEYYRCDSSLRAAAACDLLVVVGSTGTTNLPVQMARLAAASGAALIDINPEANTFSQMAQSLPRGKWLKGSAGTVLPQLVSLLLEMPAAG